MQLPWAVSKGMFTITCARYQHMPDLPLLNLINYRHHRNGEPGEKSDINQGASHYHMHALPLGVFHHWEEELHKANNPNLEMVSYWYRFMSQGNDTGVFRWSFFPS
jgi:hypothetical protein